MDFRVLGPFEVIGPEGPVKLGGAKRRGLLALLVVHTGQVVSLDRLVDALWCERPSKGSRGTVQTYLSQLRKLFAASDDITLETHPGGYLLQVSTERIDATRFEQLCAQAIAESDTCRRLHLVDEALGLWGGPPLSEFAGAEWADVEATRLEALHLQALQQRIDALLAQGRHDEAVPELEGLVTEHRLDEHFWAQLMVAYYRAGRQADALRAYQEVRSVLADELGIEPGDELADLERKILDHDPALALKANAGPSPSSSESLPEGVVTFLLTDIEGSTALWDTRPDAMSDALNRHESLVNAFVLAHNGQTIKARGEGDATLSVFPRATDALHAAVALALAIEAEQWPDDLEVPTRIALHTGEAQLRESDYYGGTLNRAARIRGLARGGQILCSRATHDLVADALQGDVELLELGKHDLRGLRRNETVYALSHPQLPPVAPFVPAPLETSDLFVGRTRELAEITHALPPAAIRSRARASSSDPPTSGQRAAAVKGANEADLPLRNSCATRYSGTAARNRYHVTEARVHADPYRRPVDRAEALQALPDTYAIALRLRDEGIEPDAVARVLDVEPEAVGPLLSLAESKLAGLMDQQ